MLLKMRQYFAKTLELFHLKKMSYASNTDEVRAKVPSFQKVTLFLGY